MVKLYKGGAFLINGTDLREDGDWNKEEARKGTIAYSILKAHNTTEDMEHLKLRFDSMASHDITFVGIVQTAKASGMEHFPLPMC